MTTRPTTACLASIAVLCAVAACATVPTDPAERAAFEAANDPFEPANREIFEFNRFIDALLIKPAAQIYRGVLPEFVRNRIHNLLDNAKQPVVFANNALQGEFTRASTTVGRFLVNSTVGIGGLFDVASDWGMPRQYGDFGQTLYAYGTPDGPYLVLPLLGPSNPRDAIGDGVDSYIDPFRYIGDSYSTSNVGVARFVADGIDKRSRVIDELDEIERTALDYYATLRSLFRQNRAKELNNGVAPPPKLEEDLYSDPAAK
ncbi:MAG TPA: VacJ family lipoprotein [Stellaceae bacterium]|jgi:phospholipid-binding lipoprotein MlaA